MSDDPVIAELPAVGTLTAPEVHAAGIGAIVCLFLAGTRARHPLRTEPWYALGGALVGTLAGGAFAKAAGWV